MAETVQVDNTPNPIFFLIVCAMESVTYHVTHPTGSPSSFSSSSCASDSAILNKKRKLIDLYPIERTSTATALINPLSAVKLADSEPWYTRDMASLAPESRMRVTCLKLFLLLV